MGVEHELDFYRSNKLRQATFHNAEKNFVIETIILMRNDISKVYIS